MLQSWKAPSVIKVLAPQSENATDSLVSMPFWTRKDGFGVISIFVGPEKRLLIGNDRVPMGARVYFQGSAELGRLTILIAWDLSVYIAQICSKHRFERNGESA